MTRAAHPRRLVRVPRRGFTLLEILVAVGAVALVSLGLAAIFSAVGETVSGGRRVSQLNQYAQLIEAQMRRDFERMTDDGFLVIRQQWADPSADAAFDPAVDRVAVSAQDTSPRARRIDEILFFARGEYTTARQPMSPEITPRATSARIYYGHGQPRVIDRAAGSLYLDPALDDANNDPNAILGRQGATNPSRFASDWILARHVTILAEPRVTPERPITRVVFGIDPATPAGALRLADRDLQMGLQPASSSIFRAVARVEPLGALPPAQYLRPTVRPRFSSGLVDIATTSLEQIRQTVTTTPVLPSEFTGIFPDDVDLNRFPATPTAGGITSRPATPESVDLMHAWMSNAFPTESDTLTDFPAAADPVGMRLRVEPQSPNLTGVLALPSTSPAQALEQAWRRADQLMLESSNFLPRCSEFIVEWSFGTVDANGEMIWFGPRRQADTNGDGVITNADATLTLPYPSVASDPSGATVAPLAATLPVVGGGAPLTYTFNDRLFYGFTPTGDEVSLTTYFGYVDPIFNADANGDGELDPGESSVGILRWPWPRLIRVTITLSDPIDPTIETSFQFVFNTPRSGSN